MYSRDTLRDQHRQRKSGQYITHQLSYKHPNKEKPKLLNTPKIISLLSNKDSPDSLKPGITKDFTNLETLPNQHRQTQPKPKRKSRTKEKEHSSSILNYNQESPSINLVLELPKKTNKAIHRKMAVSCNLCGVMLLSRNLMKEHLQRTHRRGQKITMVIFHFGIIANHVVFVGKPRLSI